MSEHTEAPDFQQQTDEINRHHGLGGDPKAARGVDDKAEMALRVLQATDNQTHGDVVEIRKAAMDYLLGLFKAETPK